MGKGYRCPQCRLTSPLSQEAHEETDNHRWREEHFRFYRRGWARAYEGTRILRKPFPHLLRAGIIGRQGAMGEYTPMWAMMISNMVDVPGWRRRNLLRWMDAHPVDANALVVRVELLMPDHLKQLRPGDPSSDRARDKWRQIVGKPHLLDLVHEVDWATLAGFEAHPNDAKRKPRTPAPDEIEWAKKQMARSLSKGVRPR